MAQRLTRRAGPEHPVLFASEADIPPAPVLPDPGAAVELDSYRALLEEAEEQARATQCDLHLHAILSWRARILGKSAEASRRACDAWFEDHKISNPPSMIRCLLPMSS